MSKRTSDSDEEKARKKRVKLSHSDGEVIEKKIATFARGNNRYSGHNNKRTKSSYQVGDMRPMFGVDRVAFRGGEGGRGWSVPSTTS